METLSSLFFFIFIAACIVLFVKGVAAPGRHRAGGPHARRRRQRRGADTLPHSDSTFITNQQHVGSHAPAAGYDFGTSANYGAGHDASAAADYGSAGAGSDYGDAGGHSASFDSDGFGGGGDFGGGGAGGDFGGGDCGGGGDGGGGGE